MYFKGGAFLFTATLRTRNEFLSRQSLVWLRGRTIGALRAERHTLTSAEWTSCSACHELLCSRAFLFIVLRCAQHPQRPRFLQIFRGIWPMPLSLLNHSALALFAQCTRIPTSARSIGFCAIWVCISSSSSSKCPFGALSSQLPLAARPVSRCRSSREKKQSAKQRVRAAAVLIAGTSRQRSLRTMYR